MVWTIAHIQQATTEAGGSFFTPEALRVCRTRVLSHVVQGRSGVFFVTSDRQCDGGRVYTVREFVPKGARVRTLNVGRFTTATAAYAMARRVVA